MSDDFWKDAEILHSYTRAQALADGSLVAVPEDVAREAGFTVPVALTRAAWVDCVSWSERDTARTGAPQDEAGRLWDVLWMCRWAIRRNQDGNRTRVRLLRIPHDGERDAGPTTARLEAVIGPGDNGEPVITIQEPGED